MSDALKFHKEWKGKIEIISRVEVCDSKDLSIAYTPGVAEPCLEIQKNPLLSYEYTRRHNLCAVITDGSAVLGLGNIGGLAGMPVMEGKCVLFKKFGGVDAIPICLKSQNTDDIVNTISNISDSFGGINLEDISAPRCFEIENRLKESLDIPIFHDDQHGTAIVTAAAIINGLKIVGKNISDVKVTILGAGAAGSAIARLLLKLDIKNILMCDRKGILVNTRNDMDWSKKELAALTNINNISGDIELALTESDVLIGVSGANTVTVDMIKKMNKDAMVFAMSNPVPEIMPELAKQGGAVVIGTGRSDFPNQINNVLAFPGIFKGVFEAKATKITEEMKLSAVFAIANLVSDKELSADYILPKAFDSRVADAVANAVKETAIKQDICRKSI